MSFSGAGGNAAEVSGHSAHARSASDTWAVADPGGNRAGNTYNGTDTDKLLHSPRAHPQAKATLIPAALLTDKGLPTD